MNCKSVRFEALEAWRKENNLYLSQAAEAFGLNVTRWASLLKENACITDRRIMRTFLLYKRYPNVLIQQIVDYKKLYLSFGFNEESTPDHKTFGQLLGVSRSSSYRILEENHAGRVVRNYVLAINRLKLHPEKVTDIIEMVGRRADAALMQGKKELAGMTKKTSTENID